MPDINYNELKTSLKPNLKPNWKPSLMLM